MLLWTGPATHYRTAPTLQADSPRRCSRSRLTCQRRMGSTSMSWIPMAMTHCQLRGLMRSPTHSVPGRARSTAGWGWKLMNWSSSVLWAASPAPDSGCAVHRADHRALWDLCAAHQRLEGISERHWMLTAIRHLTVRPAPGGVAEERSKRSLRQVSIVLASHFPMWLPASFIAAAQILKLQFIKEHVS